MINRICRALGASMESAVARQRLLRTGSYTSELFVLAGCATPRASSVRSRIHSWSGSSDTHSVRAAGGPSASPGRAVSR